MTTPIERCDTCKHFYLHARREAPSGVCRSVPPTYLPTQGYTAWQGNAQTDVTHGYPTVLPNNYCGDWSENRCDDDFHVGQYVKVREDIWDENGHLLLPGDDQRLYRILSCPEKGHYHIGFTGLGLRGDGLLRECYRVDLPGESRRTLTSFNLTAVVDKAFMELVIKRFKSDDIAVLNQQIILRQSKTQYAFAPRGTYVKIVDTCMLEGRYRVHLGEATAGTTEAEAKFKITWDPEREATVHDSALTLPP